MTYGAARSPFLFLIGSDMLTGRWGLWSVGRVVMQDMLRLGRRSRVWSFLLDVGSAKEKLGEGGERQAPPKNLMGTSTFVKLAMQVM